MNEGHENNLERELAQLTEWEGEEPALWMKALEQSANKPADRPSIIARIGHLPRRIALAASLFVVVITAIVLAMLDDPDDRDMAYSFQRPSTASMAEPTPARPGDRPKRGEGFGEDGDGVWALDHVGNVESAYDTASLFRYGAEDLDWADVHAVAGDPVNPISLADLRQGAGDPARAVVRKATIELISKDVRASFLRALILINEARSEYIGDSSLTGSGKEIAGSITLRVSAERLSEVMNAIRELGEVTHEQIHGDDVTGQVVDLDARLRNEQRVEVELLELMKVRESDELRDLLSLHEQLRRVRGTIERLQAQQQHINRMVELATILLIIRPEPEEAAEPEPEPEPEEEPSLGAYFGESVGNAWSGGLRFLVTTLARTLEVIIGGLMWWVLIVAVFMLFHQRIRQRATAQSAAMAA